MIDSQVAAKMLAISTATLRQWHRRGKIVPIGTTRTKHGRHLYRLADVQRLIAERTTSV